MHYEKYKHISAGPLLRHYDRTGTARNSDVDESRSHLNYNLCEGDGSALERLRACVGVGGNKGWAKCQQRADVNALCDWIVTMPKDLPPEYEERFFKAAFRKNPHQHPVRYNQNLLQTNLLIFHQGSSPSGSHLHFERV